MDVVGRYSHSGKKWKNSASCLKCSINNKTTECQSVTIERSNCV